VTCPEQRATREGVRAQVMSLEGRISIFDAVEFWSILREGRVN
jgi:hypothetical protein